MTSSADQEPEPPRSPLRQFVSGERNIVTGNVGPNATININAEDRATELLTNARVAFYATKSDEAFSLGAAALDLLRGTDRQEELTSARLTVGYAGFDKYRKSRDPDILTRHVVPALTELNREWEGAPGTDKARGEVLAYLAWCERYTSGYDQATKVFAEQATSLLGSADPVARWASRAVTMTKIQTGAATGGIVVFVYVIWISIVFGVIWLLSWLVDQI